MRKLPFSYNGAQIKRDGVATRNDSTIPKNFIQLTVKIAHSSHFIYFFVSLPH